jgi:hypothetical protein
VIGGPWPAPCVAELAHALRVLHMPLLGAWVREHVVEEDRWEDYAILLASMAGVWITDTVERQLGYPLRELTGFQGFAPEPGSADGEGRAAIIAVMSALNHDAPGLHGVVTAAVEAGKVDELCGHLALITSHALNRRGLPMRVGGVQ